MRHTGRKFVVVFLAVTLYTLSLFGCGGKGSPTGPGATGEVRLRLSGAVSVPAAARSAVLGGATVLVDGIAVGVTDAEGEITLRLEPGEHTITVTAAGVTSSPVEVTVAEGDVVEIEAEMAADGTLVVEQDIDHDGDIDADDLGEDDDDDKDEDDDEDEEDLEAQIR